MHVCRQMQAKQLVYYDRNFDVLLAIYPGVRILSMARTTYKASVAFRKSAAPGQMEAFHYGSWDGIAFCLQAVIPFSHHLLPTEPGRVAEGISRVPVPGPVFTLLCIIAAASGEQSFCVNATFNLLATVQHYSTQQNEDSVLVLYSTLQR